ncbi:unnamed protein product, partial [Ectocarpus fasciculatus]
PTPVVSRRHEIATGAAGTVATMLWAPSLSTEIPSPGTLGKLFGFKCADSSCYQTPSSSSRGRSFCLREGVKPESEDCKPSGPTEPSEPGASSEPGACSEQPAAGTTGECVEPSGQDPEPLAAIAAAGSAAPVSGEDIKLDDAIERRSSAAEIEPASEPPQPGEPRGHTDDEEPSQQGVEPQSDEGEQSRQ